MELAVQFDNATTTKNSLRKAYEKCNDIPQESRALIDTFLKQESDKDYEMNLAIATATTSRRETLEEQARVEKEWEERIREEQAHDELFFGLVVMERLEDPAHGEKSQWDAFAERNRDATATKVLTWEADLDLKRNVTIIQKEKDRTKEGGDDGPRMGF
ncbi:hypothetical protein Tco_0196262 [Tanacetum coccineum]